MTQVAAIFGVTGQDGSYLSELLLSKGYYVLGVARRASTRTDERIRHLLDNPYFTLHQGDVTDPLCVYRLLDTYRPSEVYNLAAQSHVGTSFDEPLHTANVTYLGALNCLEAIRSLTRNDTRFYQASSSEMFGSCFSSRGRCPTEEEKQAINGDGIEVLAMQDRFQDETTPMLPNSPYAVAKLAAHHLCRVYRDAYEIFACSGILFNHESPRRGEEFVTRKITKYIAGVVYARRHRLPAPPPLKLGNLAACRDWGHASDYVRAMWLMLQQSEPLDCVVATGETHTVEAFLLKAFARVGIHAQSVKELPVEIDPDLFRPCEVPFLKGDASLARRKLGWKPEMSFDALVDDMVVADVNALFDGVRKAS